MTDSESSWFSLKRFAVALVTVGVGAFGGMLYVPVVGTYVGTGTGAFAAGLLSSDRPLLEAGIAAVLAGVAAVVASAFVGNGIIEAIIQLLTMGVETLLISAVLSFAVGALGAHLGHDLRDGLTEPIEESGSGTSGGLGGLGLGSDGEGDTGDADTGPVDIDVDPESDPDSSDPDHEDEEDE